MSYAELHITSNFSFLRGGSHPEELVTQAVELGYKAMAITDRNTMAGIVRAHVEAKKKGIQFIPACRLDLQDGPSLLAFPTNKEAYSSLSGILTKGNLRTEKGQCLLYMADLSHYKDGILFVIIPPASLNQDFDFEPGFYTAVQRYKKYFGSHLYMAAIRSYNGLDGKKLFRIDQLSNQLQIPMVACNDVYYHSAERRQLQDVLTCIREKCTIHKAGYLLEQNAERYMKPVKEMQRLFRKYSEAIKNTCRIAQACTFSLDELQYIYPEELTTDNHTPQEELELFTWRGAEEKFGKHIAENIKNTISYELDFIQRKNYASYFLTVYDYVCFARSRNILCQGRGSAANSMVCYCLGITSVDPSKFKLLFARFMSDARNEPPDIDVDFEHERREEVMQYIYSKYGRDRAGIVATVTTVHHKGAIRDVGKAMGLSVDTINQLSKSLWEFTDDWHRGKQQKTSLGFMASDPHLKKILELTEQYVGFPRQLGQHTGGFVITQGQLSDLCPILNARMEDRTNIEWNKDDIEDLGFLKVDILALGMLTCIRKAFDLVRQHYKLDLTLANIPQDDPKVYEMVAHADTIGVFQIESRAQMSMLPRLKPKCFYDLVIEVAIVRPGPIQGDMVHPYLRRRNGQDPVEYPSEDLKVILERTLGVPLFQEQAMEIAIVAADFTPAEADGLRRSMATFKAKGKVSDWETKLINGMIKKGYKEDFARRVFKQLEGFGSYGFPESHAASFALLVYISCWLKYYYPDVFAAALLNSQPMGFYQPAQIIIDARKHGVAVKHIDINNSHWDNTLEDITGKYCPVRLGFRQIKGIAEEDMQLLTAARDKGKVFTSITQVYDTGVSLRAMERLADADAFRSLGLDRRRALWEVSALSDIPIGLFKGANAKEAEAVSLPEMSLPEHVLQDYSCLSLSLKAHPVSFLREELHKQNIIPAKELSLWPDGTQVRVAGLVLVRQRPGTAKSICFITLEDETGIANLVVFKNNFEYYRKQILSARLLVVEGQLQKEGEVIHVIAEQLFDFTPLLNRMNTIESKHNNAKEPAKKAIQGTIFPEGRNFK
ncbi:error-prone DNA polymerase [Arachidicoccus terrestris]|uniref:error-prone DNA polymerase n=1 Tax=Arachidicoccus terrestris TaxID=2875539 RepID=UPI001CC4421A|nr:error-prone DNA polymerase [Arachidicoccus terrestris]UAY56712.1 error-prone DNA polymerase [Arachidicoccus terrestris]